MTELELPVLECQPCVYGVLNNIFMHSSKRYSLGQSFEPKIPKDIEKGVMKMYQANTNKGAVSFKLAMKKYNKDNTRDLKTRLRNNNI